MLHLLFEPSGETLCTNPYGGISGHKIRIALITLFYLENAEL
jgi:hypothetical protein